MAHAGAAPRRWRRAAACLAACLLGAAGGPVALALEYPVRAIHYIVASAPGGIADTTARVLGPRLAERLGQPVVIENRAAGGIVSGGEAVAHAAPEGYQLLSATPQVAIVQQMVPGLSFDPRRDLAPVAMIGIIPNVIVVGPRNSANDLAELVALARRQPGVLNYSSTGAGTAVHLAAELLNYYAGVRIVHVPYHGAAAAMTALIAGDVDMMVDALPPSLPQIRAGRVRALAVTSASRVPQLPAVPTVLEAGYPGLELYAWSGVMTTGGTPPEVIERLEQAIGAVLREPQTAAAYARAGMDLHFMGARGFGQFIAAETARFSLAIRNSGATR